MKLERYRSTRLSVAQAELWQIMADDYGLLPQLPLDAVLSRVDRGELVPATPRMADLLVGYQLSIEESCDVAARFGRHRWSSQQRAAIEEVLDAWWQEVLMSSPGEHRQPYTPDVVLGVLVGYDAPLVRWLEPWLAELDGPGAAHLGAVILEGLTGPAWADKDDEASQVLGWARTETVINGLALIGGTHLDEGVLSDVLDRLI